MNPTVTSEGIVERLAAAYTRAADAVGPFFTDRALARAMCGDLARDGLVIIDTSTPLATPTPERRPAAGWNIDPGRDFASLNIGSMSLVASQSDDGLFRWLLDDGHHVEDAGGLPALDAAMCACEDAAARLLLAALAELPDARRLMAEVLAGREGR